MAYSERLIAVQEAQSSLLCVGLDPDLERLPRHLINEVSPADAVITFCTAIIDATAAYASAFKLNFAFFEALGLEGPRVLAAVANAIPPHIIRIADAKRGDIGNSARFYARSVFHELPFDACTVAPYMGHDAAAPFLEYPDKGVYILGRTSNPGARDFQELLVDDVPLFHHVVRKVGEWNAASAGTAGLVAGATDLEALKTIRTLAPDAPLLIPGVGAQGGKPDEVVAACAGAPAPVLINSSRGILYKSAGHDFAEAAGRAAKATRDALNG